jgi:hypothetical protein
VTLLVVAPPEESRLEEAMSSAIGQTWRPLQIVVVTTSDATALRLQQRFGLELPLEVEVVEEGLTTAGALSRALCRANGEYIAFLEPGQFLNVHHVARMVRALTASGDRAGYCDALVRTWAENGDGSQRHGYGPGVLHAPEFRPRRFPPSDEPIALSSIMIHRDCLRVVPYLDARAGALVGEDLLHRLSRHSLIRHVPTVTVELRIHDPDGSKTLFVDSLDESHRRILDSYSRFEPLELMRRVVELDNVNSYLRAELERARRERG